MEVGVPELLIVLFIVPPAEFVDRMNKFAVASGGVQNFVQTAFNAVTAAGIDVKPPFSLVMTLLVAPIAWTSLQWATYSAEQNGEIKACRRAFGRCPLEKLPCQGVFLGAQQ
jgi:hypothetical protein